jgi:regulator of Ty1 transposition protein 103
LLIVALRNFVIALSHWCIFHRKKAKEVVETWGRKFREAPREQRVPFLYLANDILQNSRRKGLEFVNEFWTVLPPLLRAVVETGDEAVRNAAFRLVDIWEERKVFGSNVRNLREELLGKGSHPSVQDVKPSALPPYYVSSN